MQYRQTDEILFNTSEAMGSSVVDVKADESNNGSTESPTMGWVG